MTFVMIGALRVSFFDMFRFEISVDSNQLASLIKIHTGFHSVCKYMPITRHCTLISHRDRRQSKTLILSINLDQESLETMFSIAICRRQMAIKNTVSNDF